METEDQHKMHTTNVTLSKAMEGHLVKVSDKAGRNPNNQARVSHGIHVLVLNDMKEDGVDTEKLYPNIKH